MTTFVLILVILLLSFLLYRTLATLGEVSLFLRRLLSGQPPERIRPVGRGEIAQLTGDFLALFRSHGERLTAAGQEIQRMEAMLRGMRDGVLITDSQGRIMLANERFRELLSVGGQVEGQRLIEVIRNIDLVEMLRKVMASNETISDEIVLSTVQRDLFLIATAIPISSGEAVTGIVFTLHDITRLRLLEEVRKDFVASVSHEIKTPLTAIRGFAETLLGGAIKDEQHALRFLLMIRNHSERLNSLVDDLLTLSRIELGDIRIDKNEVDIAGIIDTVFMTLSQKAMAKGLSLEKRIEAGREMLSADRDRLIQILINLVDNGIKFTERGSVAVVVKRQEEGFPLSVSEIRVEDTGVGIPPNHLQRLGERFYRVDRARSRELGGTGLGLAIVKHLVKAHGWDLRIESIKGRGTTVRILLPLPPLATILPPKQEDLLT